ncbi:MAG: tol-pal system protein YbgF [Pseudomonadales bacterium]
MPARAGAAAPVEESVAVGRLDGGATGVAAPPPQNVQNQQPAYLPPGNPVAAPASSQGSSDTGRLSELFYQLQLLQQEVLELRGMVEEQGHQLERLGRDQQEQYLDLDRRVLALRNGSPTPSVGATSAPTGQAGGSDAGTASTTAASASASERDAYTNAFNLMKDRQFEASADAFNQLIVQYPNGMYTPNAFYWLGELYLAQTDNERARQSFAQVVNLYPDHQKVPDALYKLGVVYHRLGDVTKAREYLNQVISAYPQSSAASLAQTYLAELR